MVQKPNPGNALFAAHGHTPDRTERKVADHAEGGANHLARQGSRDRATRASTDDQEQECMSAPVPTVPACPRAPARAGRRTEGHGSGGKRGEACRNSA